MFIIYFTFEGDRNSSKLNVKFIGSKTAVKIKYDFIAMQYLRL